MMILKEQLLQELDAARSDLWNILDALDEAIEIYPGWKKRHFLAHIAGWEAMVFEVIHRHLSHLETKDYGYTDVDNANARFISVRQSTTVQDAKLECEINRFAILTLLREISDFNEMIRFPWGMETVTKFIQGAIEHERSHASDIMSLDLSGISKQNESSLV